MEENNFIVVSLLSDKDGRLLHLHDLNSQTTFTYIDDHKGLIDIEVDGQRTVYNKHVEILEDYSINFIEMKPKPGGSNLKIHCTYNHNPEIEIIYTVIDATDNYQFTSPQGEE